MRSNCCAAAYDGPTGDHPSIRDRPLNRRATIIFSTLHWTKGALGMDAMSVKDQTRRHETWAPGDHGFKSIVGRLVCASTRAITRAGLPSAPFICNGRAHSITSSARASNDGGTLRPSALAVLRLMTSSYLVGACTGRSAGLSPLSIRST